jgi:hypothetical protein
MMWEMNYFTSYNMLLCVLSILRNVDECILGLHGVSTRIHIGQYLVWTPKYGLDPFNSLRAGR